jgi:DNA repair protein RadC
MPQNPLRYRIPRYTIGLIKDPSAHRSTITRISNSQDIVHCLTPLLSGLDREHLFVLCLDTKHGIIGLHQVAIGTLNQTIIHPREVFKAAILLNAAAIALVHNHPSGDPTPSADDRALTTRLHEGGRLLGITVLDHVILGDAHSYSFADHCELLSHDEGPCP